MNILLEQNYMKLRTQGANIAYVLEDSSTFLSTEYKVLQSQADSCFVKCMKMQYNGKVQLFYLTQSRKPFSSMIPTLDEERFLTIVGNLFSNIVDVKHNGFLLCQNIEISFEHIYVDPATYKVSLIYLPLSMKIFDDDAAFENELRTSLVRLISNSAQLESKNMTQLAADLSDGTLTIEDLQGRIKGTEVVSHSPSAPSRGTDGGTLRLIALNAPSHVELEVTKDAFTIGKKRELVDGVVAFNPMISRSHCRIDHHGGAYTISDLQSANGTYVNGSRLQPNQPYPLQNGDMVRLANSDFQVTIK